MTPIISLLTVLSILVSRSRLIVVAGLVGLFFLPATLSAQDETLEPNATSAETNPDCDTSNAHTRMSDNSDATLCDGGDASTAASYVIRLDFPTPSNDPSTTTDDQTFICRAQKSSSGGNGDPTMTLELWCNDASVEVGGTHTVGDGAIADFTETFTFNSGSCATDGSDAEIHFNVVRAGGSPGGRRSIDGVDCDWDVIHVPAGSRRAMVLGSR